MVNVQQGLEDFGGTFLCIILCVVILLDSLILL